MTANIFGERFLGRDVAWHRIGKVLSDPNPSAVGAIEESGMDYNIVKRAVEYGFDGAAYQMDNRSVLVREPTEDDPQPAPLAVVSNRYRVVQNIDIARILDELGLPERWPVETVGALGKGGTMFLTLKVGGYDVAGDPDEALEQFFIITDKRDGKTTLKIAYTPIRVVCQNTLMQGLNAATNLTNVFHRSGMSGEIKDRVSIVAGLETIQNTTLAMFEKMVATKATAKKARVAVTKAYPAPCKPAKLDAFDVITDNAQGTDNFAGVGVGWDDEAISNISHKWNRENARVKALQDGAFEKFQKFNDEHPKYANTEWGIYNAVVEHEDFRDGPESMFVSSLWGTRAKAKVRVLEYLNQ